MGRPAGIVAVLALVLTALTTPARAGELEGAVEAFVRASSAGARKEAARDIHSLNPEPAAVEALLARRWAPVGTPRTGWSVRSFPCADGVQRPWHLYVPASYDPAKAYMVLFDLHGGVSRTQIIDPGRFASRRNFWAAEARKEAFIYVLPETNRGAMWWSDTGTAYVLGVLEAVKREYSVDTNRVFASGFSDGGSGSFYLALFHSTPFAGFVPLNGHVAVAASAGKKPVYLPNLANKPLYIVNTGRDQLYPAAQVKPFIDAMRRAGARPVYRVHEEVRHTFAYGEEEKPLILAFLKKTVRNAHPERICVETADPRWGGRCHWLRLDALGETGDDFPFPDYNVSLKPTRVRIGIYIDQNYPGRGVRVDRVIEETPAAAAGLKKGDVISGMNGEPVLSMAELRQILGNARFGQAFTVRVQRDGETLLLKGSFPEAVAQVVFERPGPAGRVDAVRRGNTVEVRARGVKAYTIFLGAAAFDFEKEITVRTNGRVSFRGRVEAELHTLLELFAADRDPAMLYRGRVTVRIPVGVGEEEEF